MIAGTKFYVYAVVDPNDLTPEALKLIRLSRQDARRDMAPYEDPTLRVRRAKLVLFET